MRKILLGLILITSIANAQTSFGGSSYMNPFSNETVITYNKGKSSLLGKRNAFYEDTNPFRENARYITRYFSKSLINYYRLRMWISSTETEGFRIQFGVESTGRTQRRQGGVYIKKLQIIIDNDRSTLREIGLLRKGNGVYYHKTNAVDIVKSMNNKKVHFKIVYTYNHTEYVVFLEDTMNDMDKVISLVKDDIAPEPVVITPTKPTGTRAPIGPTRTPTSYVPPSRPLETATSLGWAGANSYDLNYYVTTFIKDAKKSGLSITPGPIDISFVQLSGETIARAGKSDRYGVLVQVDPENWASASSAMKWYIIYHELGHDILNLDHGQGGSMMGAYAPRSTTYSEVIRLKNIMFNYYKNK